MEGACLCRSLEMCGVTTRVSTFDSLWRSLVAHERAGRLARHLSVVCVRHLPHHRCIGVRHAPSSRKPSYEPGP
jgi:hypothetical protein